MKIRKIYNFKLLPNNYSAITIYPFIFFRESKENVSERLMIHEGWHCLQVVRNGWLKFYIKYIYYYIKNLCNGMNMNDAYLYIPYEIEARYYEQLFVEHKYLDPQFYYLLRKGFMNEF